MNPHAFDNLGAVERTPSPADFNLATYQMPVELPDVFTQDFSHVTVFNQSTYPTCGGHAGATFDSFLETLKKGSTTLSPKFLWKQIKLIDGYPPEVGTDMRSIMKTLASKGDCALSLAPDTLGSSLTDYTDAAQITTAQRQDGINNEVSNYAFQDNPTWDDIRQAIFQNKAVIAAVDCGDGWWKNNQGQISWLERDVLPLKVGNFASGHFVVLYGYDTQYIYFRNSWSTAWGRQGDGYFDRSYLRHVNEIGTAIVLPSQFIFTQNLWYGMSSNDVLQLQKRLGMTLQTGYFGPITLAAVKAYQTSKGIPPTGFVGVLTRTALNVNL